MRAMAFDKLCQLIGTASPTSRLITNDKNTALLITDGMMAEDDKGFTITPKGLRCLADQMEAGHVSAAVAKLKAQYEARKQKAR